MKFDVALAEGDMAVARIVLKGSKMATELMKVSILLHGIRSLPTFQNDLLITESLANMAEEYAVKAGIALRRS